MRKRRRASYRRLLERLKSFAKGGSTELALAPGSREISVQARSQSLALEPEYQMFRARQGVCPQCNRAELLCVAENHSGSRREYFDCPDCGARFLPPWGSKTVVERFAERTRALEGSEASSSDQFQWH